MRRALLILFIAATFGSVSIAARSSVAVGIGTNLHRYETVYVPSLPVTYILQVQEGLELNIGAEFGITTTTSESGAVEPSFFLPANLGLNFAFPATRVTTLFGFGLTPVLNYIAGDNDRLTFLLGPYAKATLRVRVHPIMSWYGEVQQDLLFGGDDWINTGTRITTGITFELPTKVMDRLGTRQTPRRQSATR